MEMLARSEHISDFFQPKENCWSSKTKVQVFCLPQTPWSFKFRKTHPLGNPSQFIAVDIWCVHTNTTGCVLNKFFRSYFVLPSLRFAGVASITKQETILGR